MKILIAEDDLTSRRILEGVLTKCNYDVISAKDGNEAWETLQGSDAPKIAILDWVMPGIEGIEICRRLREQEKDEDQYTYLILLTAKDSKENIIRGMEAGADDYIVKPFDQHELRVRVRAGQRIIQLQSELLATKQDLLLQSRTDPLTGVFNRRAILSQIKIELSRIKREKKQLSLSLLDIDHFKNVNDTYGHMVGDAVLRECVKRIEQVIRAYDSLGRIGGEEFLIIIPGTVASDALLIAERIRFSVSKADVHVNGNHIPITVSQGIVTCDGNTDVDVLIAMADKALFQAKDNGRNRVEKAFVPKETRPTTSEKGTIYCS